MTVKEIYDFVNFIANKHQTGDTFSIPEFNLVMKSVNLEMINAEVARYEESQKVTESVSFMKEVYYAVISTSGKLTKPSDYLRVSSLVHTFMDYDKRGNAHTRATDIDLVTNSEAAKRRSSTIEKPTLKNPICEVYGNHLQFWPDTLGRVEMIYLKRPVAPVFGATFDSATDEYVYDSSTSTQLEWPEQEHIKFAARILEKIGINLQFTQLQQYAELKKAEEANA